MDTIQKIVIIGSGHVGTHMGLAFRLAGLDVVQVYSRTAAHAQALAGKLECGYTDRMDALNPDADMYLIALTDDAIEDMVALFPYKKKLLVHTSGTTPLDALSNGSSRYGVFYPLQTFSKDVSLDYQKVPFCLEVSRDDDRAALEHLARKLSNTVQWTNSAQRRMLHVAAVFACNFVNHMYAVAADILKKQELSFDLLRPLIEETARKALENTPEAIQTGPARRNNLKVTKKHLEMLKENPDYHKMYNFISESIRKKYGFIH